MKKVLVVRASHNTKSRFLTDGGIWVQKVKIRGHVNSLH